MNLDLETGEADKQIVARLNRWRSLRIILGQLQIIGSTAAFFLLLSQGITDTVFWIFGGTMLVTLTSIILFRILRVHAKEQQIMG